MSGAQWDASRRGCTCPHGEQNLGRLHGVSMGRGIIRLTTTPGCPVHDACQGYSAEVRKTQRWGAYWCPIHGSRDCPTDRRNPLDTPEGEK